MNRRRFLLAPVALLAAPATAAAYIGPRIISVDVPAGGTPLTAQRIRVLFAEIEAARLSVDEAMKDIEHAVGSAKSALAEIK